MRVRLGDVCEIINGFAFKSEKYVDNGMRIIRITNVQNGYIEDNSPVFYPLNSIEAKKYELFEGDILISLTGNVGRVGMVTDEFLPATLNQRVGCLRVNNNEINEEYLFHFLNTNFFEQKCIESSKGIAQKNMSTEWLKNYEIKLLPMKVQKNIVNTLNKINNLIESRQQQLKKLDELVKSRFIEMFGDPVKNPYGFKKVALSELADIKIGPFGSLLHKEDYMCGGHPILNPSHIVNGKIVPDNHLTISDEKYNELEAYHLNIGDVIMGRRGEMGRCAVITSKGFLCGTGSLLIRSKGEVTADYIQKIISFPSFKKVIEDLAVGQTMLNLNVPIVSMFQIIKPPIEVQNNYYTFVEQTNKSKLEIQKSLDKLEILKKSLMQQYFG